MAPSRSAPRPFVSRQSGGGLGAAWVYVAGELDVATAPQLEQTLREAQSEARLVVLDLRELTFVDSAGVHVIVDAGI
ncbi:MAG: STAS domain-containing protein, partial [Thermoleophilaceae bacterium]